MAQVYLRVPQKTTLWQRLHASHSHPHVFDVMPSAREVDIQLFLGHVLSVTVHHRIYPVTQEVFHQVVDASGADEVYMTTRTDHAKAFVLFRSRHGASRARVALHGRNIYDGCCLMDITEATARAVLHVILSHLLYPVIGEVLHQVFAGHGARDEVYVNKATYVEALFTFRSSHAATRARAALHGSNIYDGCCRIEIQYVSLPLSNTTETLPTHTAANPTPCPASALKAVAPNEHGVAVYASPVHHSVVLVAEATSQECPVMAEQLGSNQELHRISAASDDKEQVQVKDELPGALEVFDGTPEKIRSGAKLHPRVKWVSRVRIVRRPVRMALRSKFRNCVTMPSPPPVPPRQPDQPVHHLEPCSPPQTPTLHHPPGPLSVVGGDLCSSSSWESSPDVAEISSDEEDSPPVATELCFDDQEDLSPVARNLQQKGMAGTIDKDGDDCVILDYDLHSTTAMKDEKEGSVGDGGSDEELQIVAEKGEVACRDFPHPRHLCSNMPFGTTSHQKHCTMLLG
ncbi:uncharacterized protein [Lolium perenne]|uniref:uncharacterized protein isoform X2 n=1 Tax=Lolium perenne TaxID=4522 RepID=UPI0021F58708|nr:uncharacterized protein LOC127327665 isoform X2 [Lolium perenne]